MEMHILAYVYRWERDTLWKLHLTSENVGEDDTRPKRNRTKNDREGQKSKEVVDWKVISLG